MHQQGIHLRCRRIATLCLLKFAIVNSALAARHLVPIQIARLGEGSSCGTDATSGFSCAEDFTCRCFVKNRGLQLCLKPSWPFVDNSAGEGLAARWERKGLECQPHLPDGSTPMEVAPPLVDTDGHVVDPRSDEQASAALRAWASVNGPGQGFYSRYVTVLSDADPTLGISVLAGDDVTEEAVLQHSRTVRHLLFEAAVSPATVAALSSAGVRLLIGGDSLDDWRRHPEISKDFLTGLGGGAPWFPSTGITAQEPPNTLAEELFHTIQYTAMSPRQVCLYHNAYAEAVTSGLYTTDGSGDEIDGEPVPTLQADEYLAMAMQRWFGSIGAPDEYRISGNNGDGTGRQHLRAGDPSAFCLLAQVFRSDDAWDPDPDAAPWIDYHNQPMDHDEVTADCQSVVASLAVGCPALDVAWTHPTPVASSGASRR